MKEGLYKMTAKLTKPELEDVLMYGTGGEISLIKMLKGDLHHRRNNSKLNTYLKLSVLDKNYMSHIDKNSFINSNVNHIVSFLGKFLSDHKRQYTGSDWHSTFEKE